MLNELYSFLPIVVAVALLAFNWAFDRKAKAQANKWNDYVR